VIGNRRRKTVKVAVESCEPEDKLAQSPNENDHSALNQMVEPYYQTPEKKRVKLHHHHHHFHPAEGDVQPPYVHPVPHVHHQHAHNCPKHPHNCPKARQYHGNPSSSTLLGGEKFVFNNIMPTFCKNLDEAITQNVNITNNFYQIGKQRQLAAAKPLGSNLVTPPQASVPGVSASVAEFKPFPE